MSSAGQFFNMIDRYTAQRGPYARRPVSVMIVTVVGNGWIQCRHAYESADSGYQYPYLAGYAPAVGDRVLCDNLPSGPVIQHRLSS